MFYGPFPTIRRKFYFMGSKLPRFQESVKIFRFLGWKPIFQKELLGILSEFLKMVYCSLVRRFIPMPIAELYCSEDLRLNATL